VKKVWKESAGRLPVSSRGGGTSPTGRLAYSALGTVVAIKEKLWRVSSCSWRGRPARREVYPEASAHPQHPLCSGDGLGALDTVLGRRGPKRLLGGAAGGRPSVRRAPNSFGAALGVLLEMLNIAHLSNGGCLCVQFNDLHWRAVHV
jgi:hypothetical protein